MAVLTADLDFARPFGTATTLAFAAPPPVAPVNPAWVLTADLDFARPFGAAATLAFAAPPPDPVHPPPPPDPTATLTRVAVTLLGLQPEWILGQVVIAALAVTLPGLQPAAAIRYDNQVWRGVVGETRSAMRDRQPLPAILGSAWRPATATTVQPEGRWNSAVRRQATLDGAWASPTTHDAGLGARFMAAAPARSGAGSRWRRTASADRAAWARWQKMHAAEGWIGADWHRYGVADRGAVVRWRAAQLRARVWVGACLQGDFHLREWRAPWRGGRPLVGLSWPAVIVPIPPAPPLTADIRFDGPWRFSADIAFGSSRGTRSLPVRRCYRVIHEIAITRVSDGAALEFADLTLSSDTGSWGWSLSGNALGALTYQRLTATPFTEINVRLNGLDWRFLMTSVAHHRSLGKTGYPVSGISPALALTAPLSDARSAALADPWTAQQLADQQVADTAWSIAWNAPNWPVPGGVWQYSNQTPLQVISDIATAAGAFVQAERVNRVLQVRPRYPAWPWASGWATPAVTWPLALLWNVDKTPKPGTNDNAVYAAGTRDGGIMGYVKRAGTAGDRSPGSPITHALITHVDAARAFGGTYLADAQDQVEVSFSTILGGDAPLVGLGARMDITESGQPALPLLTQAVSLAVSRGNSVVTITQSVKGVAFP
jgi:hypothetical protein